VSRIGITRRGSRRRCRVRARICTCPRSRCATATGCSFTDGLLEARDRAGRFFRVDQQIHALRRPDLQAAADDLLDRLRAHTRRRLDDDVAVLLAEFTLTGPSPGFQASVPGQRSAADVTSAVSQ
jgi:Stage II sporulation protein E (SpoIIE)